MSHQAIRPSRLLRLIAMISLSVTLAACAGRPKPLEPQYPVEVTSVRVTAADSADVGFAGTLEESLEETLGRSTRDVGRASSLRVIVRDRSDKANMLAVFADTRREAEVELVLKDNESGLDVRTRIVRASAANRDDSRTDSFLIARLTSDIRSLLGLAGYPPHRVSGAKRDLVYPEFRDRSSSDYRFTEGQLQSDPLLNGSVTPTTVNLDLETEAAPAINVAKPLLSASPTTGDDGTAAPVPVATPAIESIARPGTDLEASAEPVSSVSAAPATFDDDEPCIITIDNDCSDPDSR